MTGILESIMAALKALASALGLMQGEAKAKEFQRNIDIGAKLQRLADLEHENAVLRKKLEAYGVPITDVDAEARKLAEGKGDA